VPIPETRPSGRLAVATPIGNLDDLSARALASLKEASAVYCEDTRRTGNLFARYASPHRVSPATSTTRPGGRPRS
jgi:16S rRNA C1402 (ribose-2'-O) methylase RsmI